MFQHSLFHHQNYFNGLSSMVIQKVLPITISENKWFILKYYGVSILNYNLKIARLFVEIFQTKSFGGKYLKDEYE